MIGTYASSVGQYCKQRNFGMTKFGEFGKSMLFHQTLFAKTLKFFISVMAFKEIHQTLVTPNFRRLQYISVIS